MLIIGRFVDQHDGISTASTGRAPDLRALPARTPRANKELGCAMVCGQGEWPCTLVLPFLTETEDNMIISAFIIPVTLSYTSPGFTLDTSCCICYFAVLFCKHGSILRHYDIIWDIDRTFLGSYHFYRLPSSARIPSLSSSSGANSFLSTNSNYASHQHSIHPLHRTYLVHEQEKVTIAGVQMGWGPSAQVHDQRQQRTLDSQRANLVKVVAVDVRIHAKQSSNNRSHRVAEFGRERHSWFAREHGFVV